MKRAASIFAAADIHALDGKSNLKSVLSLVSLDPTAVMPESVLLGGDYAGIGGALPAQHGGTFPQPPPERASEEQQRRRQPVFRLENVRSEITDVFGKKVSTFFTYASHDKNEESGLSSFFCGPASCGEYHLYGISFCQMRCADEQQLNEIHYNGLDLPLGCADQGAARFTAWAKSLSDTKPIFVMSHLPLHAHRTDNRGARTWVRALNEAAETHDLFVFFAHNHTAELRSSLDRQYYFVPAGSVLPVQGREQDEQPELPINFTYLNAGYIINGCGTLLTLSDEDGDGQYDTLTIRRFSQHENNARFGSTDYANPQRLKFCHIGKSAPGTGPVTRS